MISSNTRATRSRFSSPAHAVNGNTNGSNDQSKTSSQASRDFMQRWLEPTVQSKASFEEDGFMRSGVVENMAPLGALPKNKKSGSESGTTVRKIILRPSGSGAANSASEPAPKPGASASPPPPPPPVVAPTVSSTPPRRKSIAVKAPADDDDEDEDYDPKPHQKRRQSTRSSLARRTRRSFGDFRPVSPKETKSAVKEREVKEEGQEQSASRTEPEDKEFTDKVVEAAVDEALKHYRYPTAWALRTLYDENSHDSGFVAMIERVFNQTADGATMRKFTKQIERKKREGKKENKGCYYFIPPPTNNRFTPHKPKMAPYGNLLHRNHRKSEEEHEQEHEQEQPQPDTQSEEAPPEGRASKRSKTSHSGQTHSHATRDVPRKMAPGASTTASAKTTGSNSSGSSSGGGAKGTKGAKSTNNEPRTPSRRRPRSDSASSDSSLSSAMSLPSPDVSSLSASPGRRGKRSANRPRPDSSNAPKSQPITARRKSLASKTKQPRSSPSTSNSPAQQDVASNKPEAHASARANMPGRVSTGPLFPNLSSKSAKTAKGKAPMPSEEPITPDDDPDSFWDRRREARQFANSVSVMESSVRGSSEEQPVTPVKATRKTRQSTGVPPTTRSTRSASKRPLDEPEVAFSPSPWSFPGDGSSTVGSRAVTPTLRQAKKQKVGPRTKSSPVKKRGGTAAGLPRPGGDSFSGVGTSKDQASDNEEDCSACGAAGDVLCCDGCPRSFHFECVGMSRSDNLPDEWFCSECSFKRFPQRIPQYKGIFASALRHLEKSIPRSFGLPKSLQERFEGVRAGADGDYEEITTAKPARKRPGYEEVVDFFRQREDGQAVLCHACQKSATDVRAIMPCSACSLHWHLDCLDPPLAVPPVPKTWRCPLHTDDVWCQVQRLAPAHRFRKIKGSSTISPALSRGLKNNGLIEVDWEGEPEEDNKSGWPDPASFGRNYKLPANGIVLDFIEQLRRQGAGYGPRQDEPRWLGRIPMPIDDPTRPVRGTDLHRTVDELQVSLTLANLKQSKSDSIDELVSALLKHADPNVVALMAKNDASSLATGHLTDNDKIGLRAMLTQLEAMSARIRDVLGEVPPSAITAAMLERDNEVANILSPEESVIEPNDKMTPTPVTEPTPPSTIDNVDGTMDLD